MTSTPSTAPSTPPTPTHGPRAWVVLLTTPTYLPGVVLLSHTLRKVGSKHPLVVATPRPSAGASGTGTLPAQELEVLHKLGLEVRFVDPIIPRVRVDVVAERFVDTWTKLAVFGMVEFEKIVLLDADILVLRNMDELFDIPLPSDWIAANHACVCGATGKSWAPPDWIPSNCAYTPLTHPSALRTPTAITATSPRTHTLLNSGLVLLHPSHILHSALTDFLHTSPLTPTFVFPDQDLLAEFFRGRWWVLPWMYNAVKTARWEHSAMWRDEEVRGLHYIVGKPWMRGREGAVGRDGELDGVWWGSWEEWEGGLGQGEGEVREVVGRWVVR